MVDLFELSSSAVISVQPVIEIATSMIADDIATLPTPRQARFAQLDLYDRNSFLS
jgi:hypothetical protein